ncbi:o-succinylbenzoate synthase [uncultured Sunxiuqinia sp.]|uniref:o-succinylbenzoate synthase n=1 Tax=uncultured Sunxiuqinia sp. TaxID=1573825 RepID=UPI002AA80870|nr:o-succinylbenzoate synthase [uncultured Sunxiuqinia sp.]
MIAYFKKYQLHFKRPAGTSRGVYNTRIIWLLFLKENERIGIGECAPLPDLSKESPEQVEQRLKAICANPNEYIIHPELLQDIPSVRFGLEAAKLDLENGGNQILFPSTFTSGEEGIPINGLIWMGDYTFMQQQIREKSKAGFQCIKLKIGAINFERELSLLQSLKYLKGRQNIMIRADANGAFQPDQALQKLNQLAEFDLHSIEQPIAAGQWEEMAKLCDETPIPIALDEELIGINSKDEKEALLDIIRPQFLVLKPSLHGGFAGCDEWINLANERSIGWWITSYLESNIGLNAIAQWIFTKHPKMYQGLGTGQLFTNNFDSPLEIRGEQLWFDQQKTFVLPEELSDPKQ